MSSFITLVTLFCLGEVCNLPKSLTKITINSADVVEIADFQYYWLNEGKVQENGIFIPNENATRMRGCRIKVKSKQMPYFSDIPCDMTRARLEKPCRSY